MKCTATYEWDVRDAFNKWGFDDGDSNRNYTGKVASVIEDLGYEVNCDAWGMHNYVIDHILNSDGVTVYGGDHPLFLAGYYDYSTIGNTLPADIAAALRAFDETCTIEGYQQLDDFEWEASCGRPACRLPNPDVRVCCEPDCPTKNSNQQLLCCPKRVTTMVFHIGNHRELYKSIEEHGFDGFWFLEMYGFSTEDMCAIIDGYHNTDSGSDSE